MEAWKDFKNLDLSEMFGALLIILGLVLVSSIAIALLTAKGDVDFCYIDNSSYARTQNYTLKGHRSWKPDVQLGNFDSFDESLAAAVKISCPMIKLQ